MPENYAYIDYYDLGLSSIFHVDLVTSFNATSASDRHTDGRTEMLRAPHEAVVLTRDIS